MCRGFRKGLGSTPETIGTSSVFLYINSKFRVGNIKETKDKPILVPLFSLTFRPIWSRYFCELWERNFSNCRSSAKYLGRGQAPRKKHLTIVHLSAFILDFVSKHSNYFLISANHVRLLQTRYNLKWVFPNVEFWENP